MIGDEPKIHMKIDITITKITKKEILKEDDHALNDIMYLVLTNGVCYNTFTFYETENDLVYITKKIEYVMKPVQAIGHHVMMNEEHSIKIF